MASVGSIARGLLAALLLGAIGAGCTAGEDSSADPGEAAQEVQSSDYSGARWIAASANNYTAGRGAPVRYIVVHDTEGTYDSAISWFQNSGAQVSAHYVIRSSDGQITQMVHESNTTWHCASHTINHESIGIEHEGFLSNPGHWYTDAMYRSSARLVAHLVHKYGIPIDRTHIVGHYQVVVNGGVIDGNRGYNACLAANNGNHSDPGAGWDWDRYMRYIREYAGAAPAPAPGGDCGAYAHFTMWNCLPGTHERVRCVSGHLEREACEGECDARPSGQDDVCAPQRDLGACGSHAADTLWNCQSDGHSMLKCVSGQLHELSCSRGCSARPNGQNDVCN